MAKRISDWPEIVSPDGEALVMLALNGANYNIRIKNLAKAVPVPTKAQIGLGNVDNTADTDKPISTATQEALDQKAALTHTHPESQVEGLSQNLAAINQTLLLLTTRLSAAEGILVDMGTQVSKNTTDIADTTAAVDTLTSGLSSANGRIDVANVAITTLTTTVEGNTLNIETLLSDTGTLSSKVDALTTQAQAMDTRLSNDEDILTNVQTLITGFGQSLATTNAALAQLKIDVRNDEIAFAAMSDTVDAHTTQIADLAQQIAANAPTTVFDKAQW